MNKVISLCACAVLLLGGCAVAERDITEVGDQVGDGLVGRGRIVERDPTTDSFGSDFE